MPRPMKTLFFTIDVLIGFAAMGSFAAAFIARLNSDGDAWQKYMKIFAICAGLLAILFTVAAIFDIQFLPKQK